MSEMMTFPDTWEEFEKSYGFTDNEEVYTNGARLIPSFRAKQWLDHLPSVHPDKDLIHLQKEQAYMQGYEDGQKPRKGKWKRISPNVLQCEHCKKNIPDITTYISMDFCPNCGSYNGGDSDG